MTGQIGLTAANFASSAARLAVAAPVAVIGPEALEVLKLKFSSDAGSS